MIPKKIHFCWFSGDPYSEKVEECISSWRKAMPDYELVKWDMARIKDIDSVWLKECLAVRKWAFAADFVRLWAVFHEGGIYLDSDVMIYQSLDPFLSDKMFIGRENLYYPTLEDGIKVFLTSHCFGAEPGHPFLGLCLEYYQDRHFIGSSSERIPNELRYNMLMMPYIQSSLAELFGYNPSICADHKQVLSNGVTVYPTRYFNSWLTMNLPFQHYAQHLGIGGWREPEYWNSRSSGTVKYTLWYKIRWRLKFIVNYIFAMFGFVLVKISKKEDKDAL